MTMTTSPSKCTSVSTMSSIPSTMHSDQRVVLETPPVTLNATNSASTSGARGDGGAERGTVTSLGPELTTSITGSAQRVGVFPEASGGPESAASLASIAAITASKSAWLSTVTVTSIRRSFQTARRPTHTRLYRARSVAALGTLPSGTWLP